MRGFDITWVLAFISLLGNFLNAKKKISCFYLWGVGEIFWFMLDIKNGAYGRATLDLISLGMAMYGIHEWRNNKNN